MIGRPLLYQLNARCHRLHAPPGYTFWRRNAAIKMSKTKKQPRKYRDGWSWLGESRQFPTLHLRAEIK